MNRTVRIGACQATEVTASPAAALACMLRFAKQAEARRVDLLLFPECYLSGYILQKEYMEKYAFDFASEPFAAILRQLGRVKPVLVFGTAEKRDGKYYNSAVVVRRGEVEGVYRKTHLLDPNEGFFTPGNAYPVFAVKGLKYGVNICYDAQFPEAAGAVARQGARLLLLPAQNMLRREKAEQWKHKHGEIGAQRVRETGLWLVRADVTGVRPAGRYGPECIAYGPTQAVNPQAKTVAQAPLMTSGIITVDIPVGNI